VNTTLKENLDKVQEWRINNLAEDYSKFEGNWGRFYATIMGQLCPAMKEELRNSSKWEAVAAELDPGNLLSLIQTTCLMGTTRIIIPIGLSAEREMWC